MDLSWRIRDNGAVGDIPVRESSIPKYENCRMQSKYDRRFQQKFIETETTPLRVNLLGMMNNERDSSVFVEGHGNLGIVRDLSDMFPPGNRDNICIKKNTDKTRSWIISQSGALCERVTKLATEYYERGEELIQQQAERVEPAHTFLTTNPDRLKKLNVNIVTNRGVLKKFMTLRKPCEILVTRNEDNVLTISNQFKPYGCEGIDVSAGTTFVEYLNEEPKDIYEPVKRTYGIYHMTIGDSSVLYHAEIDGLNSEVSRDPNVPLTTKDFIEVKTVSNVTLPPTGQEYFFRQRSSEWWAQCALAGIETVVCGILNEKHKPYAFNSRFIEIEKLLHVKVSEFSNKSKEVTGSEHNLWSEKRLTHQLKSILDQLRQRFEIPGIETGKKYKVCVGTYKDIRTGEIVVHVGEPCKVL